MTDYRHGDNFIPVTQPDATYPDRGATVKDADLGGGEADGTTGIGHQHHIVLFGTDAGIDELGLGMFVFELHRDLAVGFHICEI